MSPSKTTEVQSHLFHQFGRSGVPASGLLRALSDRAFLTAALERVRSSDGAATPGPDGVTAEEFAAPGGDGVARLERELRDGSWHPAEPRWFRIGKGAEGQREIGILNVRDRVVHTGLKQLLEPLLEPRFHPHSFGYRPGRSVPAALERLCTLLAGRGGKLPAYGHALPLDVVDCFPSIDQGLLLAGLRTRIDDREFLDTVRRAIACGAGSRRRWLRRRPTGLVQGSALSPLLSNQFLDALDRRLERRSVDSKRRFHFLRYSDDVLLLATGPDELERARRQATAAARRLGLELQSSRGSALQAEHGIPWLGVEVRARRLGWESEPTFGYHVPDPKVESMLERIAEMTEPPSSRLDAAAVQLGPWIRSLNEQLRSWHQAYDRADNARAVFAGIDRRARERMGALLRSVLGKGWAEVEKRHGTTTARGFPTYAVDGTRLVVLSSLAPRSAHNLIRRPAWARAAA